MSMPLHVTSFPVGRIYCDAFRTPPKRCHTISLSPRCASWAVQRTVTVLSLTNTGSREHADQATPCGSWGTHGRVHPSGGIIENVVGDKSHHR
jgi:hypothetical protein